MKKILLLILIAVPLFFLVEETNAIYYNGTAITSWVFPDMKSSTWFYLWYAWGNDVMWSNWKYGIFYRDSTNTGTIAYKSQICFWMKDDSPQGDFYLDSSSQNDARLYLSYSGTSVVLNLFGDDGVTKVLSGEVLATKISGSWVTSSDNHPTENVLCSVISYVVRSWQVAGNWRYLYSISTFHYTRGTTFLRKYRFFEDSQTDSQFGIRYRMNTIDLNPLYLNTHSVRYDFYFESSTISSNLWYTPERNSYRQQLLGDLFGASNSGNLQISLPEYYNSEIFNTVIVQNPKKISFWPDFSLCGNFEISCYVSTFFSWVTSYIPDLSFSEWFNSCATGSSSTWWTTSEKLSRLISIINPIPPNEGTLICGLFWSWILDYSQASQSGNIFTVYAHWQVPKVLESDWIIAYGQNLLDIVVIIGVFILIFRPKKNV